MISLQFLNMTYKVTSESGTGKIICTYLQHKSFLKLKFSHGCIKKNWKLPPYIVSWHMKSKKVTSCCKEITYMNAHCACSWVIPKVTWFILQDVWLRKKCIHQFSTVLSWCKICIDLFVQASHWCSNFYKILLGNVVGLTQPPHFLHEVVKLSTASVISIVFFLTLECTVFSVNLSVFYSSLMQNVCRERQSICAWIEWEWGREVCCPGGKRWAWVISGPFYSSGSSNWKQWFCTFTQRESW